MSDIQGLVAQLQDALGLKVTCGSITLNVNESRLSSFETKTHQRIMKPVDSRRSTAQDLTT